MDHLWITGPTRDSAPARFAVDLAELYAYTITRGPWRTVSLRFQVATYIHVGREACLEGAIADGATEVLWLDTDMGFPRETAVLLAMHDQRFVAANCVTRTPDRRFTAQRGGVRVETGAASSGLDVVDSVGLAVALMRTEVARALRRPWFTHGRTATGGDIGEDIMFCNALRAAGVPVLIDHDLSKEIKHVGQYEYGPPCADDDDAALLFDGGRDRRTGAAG
jgi:hypothetical protein